MRNKLKALLVIFILAIGGNSYALNQKPDLCKEKMRAEAINFADTNLPKGYKAYDPNGTESLSLYIKTIINDMATLKIVYKYYKKYLTAKVDVKVFKLELLEEKFISIYKWNVFPGIDKLAFICKVEGPSHFLSKKYPAFKDNLTFFSGPIYKSRILDPCEARGRLIGYLKAIKNDYDMLRYNYDKVIKYQKSLSDS